MSGRDPFEVLGIERGASADAIKRAYKKMARRHHPDLNPHRRDAALRFHEVVEAYQRLSDDDFGQREGGARRGRGGDRSAQGGRGADRSEHGAREGAAGGGAEGGGADGYGADDDGTSGSTSTYQRYRAKHRAETLRTGPSPRDRAARERERASRIRTTAWGEAEFIVKLHIQGLKAMQMGGLLGALAACIYTSITNKDASPFYLVAALLPAYYAALTMRRYALRALAIVNTDTEFDNIIADVLSLLAGSSIGVVVMHAVPGADYHLRGELGAMVGGGICAYCLGRFWNDRDKLFSIVVGHILGLPAGALLCALFASSIVFGFRGDGSLADAEAFPEILAAGLVGAFSGGSAGGLIAMLFRRRE